MPTAAQLVLLCDRQGAILEAKGPWAEVAQGAQGATLGWWVADSGSGLALDFLFELHREGASFGHRLPMAGESSSALSFAGLMAGEFGWLIAAASERELRAACRDLLTSVADLPHRPSRENCELLNRLVTSGGGEWPRRRSVGSPESSTESSAETLVRIEGGVTGLSAATLASVRELLGILAHSGMALFEEPLSADQARVAAAVARKSEAAVALLTQDRRPQDAAEEPLAIEPVVQESVALHRTLAARRKVELTVELRQPLGRMRLNSAVCELWLDTLLAGAVDLAPPGDRVEVVASVEGSPEVATGNPALQLVFRLVASLESARERLAVAKRVAQEAGGSLLVSPVGEAVEVVARLPATSG